MFSIQGMVTATGAGETVAGLTILALDTLDGAPAVVATTTTDDDGAFVLPFELGDIIRMFRGDPDTRLQVPERAANLYLTVLREGVTLARQDVSLTLRDLLDSARCIELRADLGGTEGGRARHRPDPRNECRYFVRGALLRADSTPVPSTRIELIEKRLRHEEVLGTTRTGREGSYEITYGGAAPGEASRPGKSIYARAVDAAGEEIARSTLHGDVAVDVRIDLVVGNAELRGPARSTATWRSIEGRLDGLALSDLTADDVELLARSTREDIVQVAYLVRSAKLEAATGVTRDAFFAFGNAGLPTTLVGLLGQDRETLQLALEAAEKDGVVPPWRDGQVEQILDALGDQVLELSVPAADPSGSLLGELLLTGGVSTSLPRQFIEAYLTREGTVEEFWDDFRTSEGASTTDTVQFTLAIGALTGNHVPLVQALQAMRTAAEITGARDLAKLTAAEWEAILAPGGGGGPSAPEAFPGETEAERITNYAVTLARVFESAYPTAAVAGGLSRAAVLDKVVEFTDLNQTFDFLTTTISTFLGGTPVLPGGDISTLQRDLEHVQRLHAIAPRFDKGNAVATMLASGIVSAQQVARMGYSSLAVMFETALGTEATKQVYVQALQQTAKVATYVTKFAPPFVFPTMYVLQFDPQQAWPSDKPTLEALFGAQGFCACEHCRSIFGPAQYLAALLLFLRDQPFSGSPDGTLLGILRQRRPDIEHVMLNCANAHTVMPAIDLTNEVLERRIAAPSPPPTSSGWPQTTWTTAELRAHPEHLIEEAYGDTHLRGAIFPWLLPFDLSLEEARGYLDHLGVRLSDLMDVLQGHDGTQAHAIAVEALRLSPTQAEVIEGQHTYSSAGEPWGQPQGTWVSDLADARLFVTQAELDYDALLDLLYSDYATSGAITLEHDPEEPCTLDGATLTGLTAANLERIHRFVRLSRRITWSFFDLDVAIRALGTNATDQLAPEEPGPPVEEPTFLGRLARVVEFLGRFGALGRAEVCAWFGLLDTWRGRADEHSFYESVFLDRTVAADNQAFSISPGASEVDDPEPVLTTDERAAVAAALRLSDGDIAALIESLEGLGLVVGRNLLTLTRLYRRASLSRALGLSARDLVRFVALCRQQPFVDGVAASPDVAHTRAFITRVDRFRQSGFTLADLDYLLRHRFETGEPVALQRERVEVVFVDVMRGLQDIAAQTTPSADAVSMLRDRLGQVIDEAFVDAAVSLVQGEDIGEVVPGDLQDELEKFLSVEEAVLLFEPPQGSPDDARTVEERLNETLAALLTHIRRLQMTALVIQRLSGAVGLDTATGELLLGQLDAGSPGVALDLFLADEFVFAVDFETDAEAIKTEGFPALSPSDQLNDHFVVFERLYKAAVLLQRFRFSYAETAWLLGFAAELDLLDPLALPVPPTVDPELGLEQRFLAWEKLARLVRLRDAVFRDRAALFDLLADVSPSDPLDSLHLDALSAATGWDREELGVLVATGALDVDGAAIRALDGLERLERAVPSLRRLGVGVARALSWVTTTVDAGIAQSVKNTTRGKYAPDRWPDIIGPLRDQLRERQRDALVAYHLATSGNPDLIVPDDLLGELLLDVLGQSCQRTSRVVQATASVQLLVQRILMGLEPGIELTDLSARIWQWMSRFQVWAANRRVFCYPENYVEPELRDDRSPFFRELAEALLEGEPTERRVSDAYLGYLTKLDEVARLSVSGLYHQIERDQHGEVSFDTMHVFARTIAKPYTYFYRRFVDATFWTPWQKVPLGIEADDVIPIVVDRRLLLMWPIILEDAEQPDSAAQDGSITKPKKFLRIRMSLSECIDGEWTQPLTSEEDETLDAIWSEDAETTERVQPASRIHYETWHKAGGTVEMWPRFKRMGDDANVRSLAVLSLKGREISRSPLAGLFAAGYLNSNYAGPATTAFHHQAFRGPVAKTSLHVPTRNPTSLEIVPSDKIFTAQGRFEIMAIRHNKPSMSVANVEFGSDEPFFYQDRDRAFFVVPFDQYGSAKTPWGGLVGNVAKAFINPDAMQPDALQTVNIALYSNFQTDFDLGADLDDPPDPPGDTNPIVQIVDAEVQGGMTWTPPWQRKRFDFRAFHHAYVPRMIGRVERAGVRGLLDPPTEGPGSEFRRQLASKSMFPIYTPTDLVRRLDPENFDFSYDGAYSGYNWELYFHGPMLMADRLMATNRFAEAREWLHTIFDPTETEGEAPRRFWKLKPFYEALDPANIVDQLESLSYDGEDPDKVALREATEKQIEQWRKNPFNPHLLARLRPLAYQRATVMKYLDVLIAWGDHLFRQATREAIGQALQLYVLAAQILGPRPERIRARTPPDRSFAELAEDIDAFANALVELENHHPPGHLGSRTVMATNFTHYALQAQSGDPPPSLMFPLKFATEDTPEIPVADSVAFATGAVVPQILLTSWFLPGDVPPPERALYFCVPPNDKLLGYWDTVADRLFKIRNCLSIEGARLELPLFEPPIDPALLAKAAAAGIDMSSAIAALNAPLPHYRFRTVVGVAKEYAAEVRSLGQALQAALERKDTEALAELRTTHELRLIEAGRDVREQQIEDAKQTVVALRASRAVVEQRRTFFRDRQLRIATELQQQGHLQDAERDIASAQRFEDLAAVLGLLPNVQLGIQGGFSSPAITATAGGQTFAQIYGAQARWHTSHASIRQGRSSLAGIEAGLTRRDEDWNQEIDAGALEIERIDQEITAAEIRVDIAEKELANHDLQIRQAREVDEFMQSRYTHSELYGWMAREIGRSHYQAYQLAYDLAKRAERTYQLELATPESSFIQFGYWDNQRQGLFAGEKLLHDLRRLEAAHLQNNRRELELTKRVSLAQVDPVALLLLRETGRCWLEVDEALFDLTHPGHYLRRIKSVSVTVSTVGDPVAEIPVTLTLQRSAIRRSPSTEASALVEDYAAGTHQIATSTGEDDAGLFERNFNDERYLPFEGRGAVSTWLMQLPQVLRPFDYGRITDVVLQIAYTARQGGELFRSDIEDDLQSALAAYSRQNSFGDGMMHMLSVRRGFADAWNLFVAPTEETDRELELDVSRERFPWRFHPGEIEVERLWLLTLFKDAAAADAAGVSEPGTLPIRIDLPGLAVEETVDVTPPFAAGGINADRIGMGQHPTMSTVAVTTGTWAVRLATAELEDASELEDLIIVVQYRVNVPPPEFGPPGP